MTDEKPDLKRCPFCDSDQQRLARDIYFDEHVLKHKILYVECLDCGAEGPHSTYGNDPITGWNYRYKE